MKRNSPLVIFLFASLSSGIIGFFLDVIFGQDVKGSLITAIGAGLGCGLGLLWLTNYKAKRARIKQA